MQRQPPIVPLGFHPTATVSTPSRTAANIPTPSRLANKFAILYPQGQGWLHIGRLNSDVHDCTLSLVRSASTSDLICVRKRSKPWRPERDWTVDSQKALAEIGDEDHLETKISEILTMTNLKEAHHHEITVWRSYEQSRKLIDWTERSRIDLAHPEFWRRTNTPYKRHSLDALRFEDDPELRITSSVSQYCNGGTLGGLIRILKRKGKSHIQELGWRCLSDLLDSVWHLFCGSHQPVCFDFLTTANVVLHFPDAHDKLPRFLISDIENASFMDGNIQQVVTLTERDCAQIANLLCDVAGMVYETVVLDKPYDSAFIGMPLIAHEGTDAALRQADLATISANLKMALQELLDISEIFEQHGTEMWVGSTLDGDIAERLRKLKEYANTQNSEQDLTDVSSLRYIKSSIKTTPKVWDTREELQAQNVLLDGPWKIATVNPQTFEVVDVDDILYGRYSHAQM